MMTLGLFLIVINALMFLLVGAISDELGLGFTVADFFAALLGAIVMGLVGMLPLDGRAHWPAASPDRGSTRRCRRCPSRPGPSVLLFGLGLAVA